jgi:hypothetical protein
MELAANTTRMVKKVSTLRTPAHKHARASSSKTEQNEI